ncbi:Low temperature requirement protein LtrA [Glycomyces sambucus]|uniref:Low temperature requirement protein LtrA n=1 Tax=Glycomyces sambucus TaxID=380244 RepID=A0A1G9DG45_9ACTN|nr:low temperature requirement protein A [Glycomyces sambucus]SDK62823.1 Low temperature requirement protein LtrA [Glycomyces sambucus]
MVEAKRWRVPIATRDHTEGHRQATWLELFFDLSFVVAVAQAATQFEHAAAEGHLGEGLLGFVFVFAAIWWIWVSFTWFANFFDTDDVPYRLLMMVMIAGSLGLAAGVPQAAHLDFRIFVVSYVVMRLAYVAQWARVYRHGDPAMRGLAGRIIVLTTFVQLGWVAFLLVPTEWRVEAWIAWFLLDLAVPLLARWNPRLGGHWGHIKERYGLFTIIVLGEAVAAATIAVSGAVDSGLDFDTAPLLTLAAAGLVVVFALWWIYFDFSGGHAFDRGPVTVYVWAYAHYFVFAAVAALGAGTALAVERITDPAHVHLSDRAVALIPAVAVAVILLTTLMIEAVSERGIAVGHVIAKFAAAAVTIGAALLAPVLTIPGAAAASAATLAALVVYGVIEQHYLYRRSPEAAPGDPALGSTDQHPSNPGEPT